MTLPERVQALVDDLIAALQISPRPSSLVIHLNDDGVVQVVTPSLTYRRKR